MVKILFLALLIIVLTGRARLAALLTCLVMLALLIAKQAA